eukprot:1592411-Amphidinium_carterae.2
MDKPCGSRNSAISISQVHAIGSVQRRQARLVTLHDASVAFFHALLDENLIVIPPPGMNVGRR